MRIDRLTGLKGTTQLVENDEFIHVYYHDTKVFKYQKSSGEVTLDSGGWNTFMTATKMNQAFRQFNMNKYRVKYSMKVLTLWELDKFKSLRLIGVINTQLTFKI